MKRWRLFALLAFNTLLAAGCHLPSASGAKRLPLPAGIAAEFSYSRPDGVVCQENDSASKPGYSIKRVEVTSPSGQGAAKRSLVLDYFVPQTDGKHPVLLILPMLGGSYPLEKYFANYFVKRGFASIIVHREKPPKDATFEIL